MDTPSVAPPLPTHPAETIFRELTVLKPGRPPSFLEKTQPDEETSSIKYSVKFDRGSHTLPLVGLFLTYSCGAAFISVGAYLRNNGGIIATDIPFGDIGVLYNSFSSTGRSFINLGEFVCYM